LIILGIHGGLGGGYQDAAAALLINGKLAGAIEEERLTRIKHAPGRMPTLAIAAVLEMAKIGIRDVDIVAFHGITWRKQLEEKIKNYFIYTFGYCPELHLVHHHHAHAASAFYSSPFEEALIITADGSGDGVSTRISVGKGLQIELLKEYYRPQSLGLFYSAITQLCGFKRDHDEYKLMGLAAYGDHRQFDLAAFLTIQDGTYQVNTDFLIDMPPLTPSPNWQEMLFTTRLEQYLKLPRRIEKTITQPYKDLAASAQHRLETAMCRLVQHYVSETGIRRVCLAGGVALNCKMNQRIMELPEVEALFVPPVAADMGIALGAAMIAHAVKTGARPQFTSVYCGNAYTDDSIQSVFTSCGIPYTKVTNPASEAARLLAGNKIIGWFQGSMEYGPRALGNRSILANPMHPEMKDLVNRKIKFRESFRPFGASVAAEDAPLFFKGKNTASPYMTVVYAVKEEYQKLLQAVTHADGSCRIQTVDSKQNALFYELLQEFKKLTGHAVLLNTSFNLSHEPMVCTPRDAVATFYASGLDALFIGNFMVSK
jgi:carbamoyltransferase